MKKLSFSCVRQGLDRYLSVVEFLVNNTYRAFPAAPVGEGWDVMEPIFRQSALAAHQWTVLGHVHLRLVLGVPLRYGARVLSGQITYMVHLYSVDATHTVHMHSVDDTCVERSPLGTGWQVVVSADLRKAALRSPGGRLCAALPPCASVLGSESLGET